MNLQNLFGKKEISRVETILSADEIEPIFKAHGIDMDRIGFPFIKLRKNIYPTEKFWISFDNVTIRPIKIQDEVKTIINGTYTAQACCSYQTEETGWLPGLPNKYYFKIEDGKLEVKVIN